MQGFWDWLIYDVWTPGPHLWWCEDYQESASYAAMCGDVTNSMVSFGNTAAVLLTLLLVPFVYLRRNEWLRLRNIRIFRAEEALKEQEKLRLSQKRWAIEAEIDQRRAESERASQQRYEAAQLAAQLKEREQERLVQVSQMCRQKWADFQADTNPFGALDEVAQRREFGKQFVRLYPVDVHLLWGSNSVEVRAIVASCYDFWPRASGVPIAAPTTTDLARLSYRSD